MKPNQPYQIALALLLIVNAGCAHTPKTTAPSLSEEPTAHCQHDDKPDCEWETLLARYNNAMGILARILIH